MKKPNPPKVRDEYRYVTEAPPEMSARCAMWVSRIKEGWQRNKRISAMGYATGAPYFGVYVWEYIEVLLPLLQEQEDG